MYTFKLGNFTFTYIEDTGECGELELDLISVKFMSNEISHEEMDAINDDHVYELALAAANKENDSIINKAA